MKKIIIAIFMASIVPENLQAISLKIQGTPGGYQDSFMEQVVNNYSTVENGIPKISKDKAKDLAFQVLTRDAGMKDAAANSVIGDGFEKTWAHFDVNSADKIDSDLVVPLFHMLAHDDTLQFSLDPPSKNTCEKYGMSKEACKIGDIE